MIRDTDLIRSLRRMKIETGSLVCLGCGYEQGCSVRGCRVLREAAERLEQLTAEDKRRNVMVAYEEG